MINLTNKELEEFFVSEAITQIMKLINSEIKDNKIDLRFLSVISITNILIALGVNDVKLSKSTNYTLTKIFKYKDIELELYSNLYSNDTILKIKEGK